MPSTPEGAGSFGSDQEEPPEEHLNVCVNLRMGYSGEVLYTAQWHSTDTVSIGRKLHVPETSIALAIGTDCFDQQFIYAQIFKLKSIKAIVAAREPQYPGDGGTLNIDVIMKSPSSHRWKCRASGTSHLLGAAESLAEVGRAGSKRPQAFARRAISRSHPKTPTGVQPWRPQDVACPQTPPKTMLLPVPLQPGSPAKAQRHCPECQSPQLVGGAHICHSTEPNCKRLKMSICDQPSELSQCGVGLQMQDDSHRLCEGEQELFLDALRQALQLIHVDYETVTIQVMVRDAKWDDLKAIQASVDFLSECVAQRHAGVPGCWSKRTALQTIDRVCNDFAKQPLMKRAIAHLQEWGGRCGVFCSIHEVLQDFSASWDLLWERQKEDFVNSNSWQQLQWLTDMRNRLPATLSGDANVERPNQQHALQELLNSKKMLSGGSFLGLEKAIQRLTPDGRRGQADTQGETGSEDEHLRHCELEKLSCISIEGGLDDSL